MPVLRRNVQDHLNVCVSKYVTCKGCDQKIVHKFLFAHLTGHCLKRWRLCTNKKDCCFAIEPGAKPQLHECPELEFAQAQSLKFGMIVDINRDLYCWTTYVLAEDECKRTHFCNAYAIVGQNTMFARSDRLCVYNKSKVAPGYTFTKESCIFPGKMIDLPLSMLRKYEFAIGHMFVLQGENMQKNAILIGKTMSDAKYITMHDGTLLFHQFVINRLQNDNDNNCFERVPCEVVNMFTTDFRVKYQEKHFLIPRLNLNTSKILTSRDLIVGHRGQRVLLRFLASRFCTMHCEMRYLFKSIETLHDLCSSDKKIEDVNMPEIEAMLVMLY